MTSLFSSIKMLDHMVSPLSSGSKQTMKPSVLGGHLAAERALCIQFKIEGATGAWS